MISPGARLAIIFDLDDLLIDTQALYAQAYAAGAAIVAPTLGVSATDFLERRLAIARRLDASLGVVREMVPLSMAEAYRELAREKSVAEDPRVTADLLRLGGLIYAGHAAPLPGALAVLHHFRRAGVRMIILTRGERDIQERRLQESGIWPFVAKTVVTALAKRPEQFAALADTTFLPRSSVWAIGDGVASDILPALAAGLSAVWIPAPRVWTYQELDHSPSPRFRQIDRIGELPRLLTIEARLRAANSWGEHQHGIHV